MKTHLNRPTKILYFFPAGDLNKVQHNFKIFSHFQQDTTYKLSCTDNKGFSCMLFLFVLYFHGIPLSLYKYTIFFKSIGQPFFGGRYGASKLKGGNIIISFHREKFCGKKDLQPRKWSVFIFTDSFLSTYCTYC